MNYVTINLFIQIGAFSLDKKFKSLVHIIIFVVIIIITTYASALRNLWLAGSVISLSDREVKTVIAYVVMTIGPGHTYPFSFENANIFLRFKKYSRPRDSVFESFLAVHANTNTRFQNYNSLHVLGL